MMGCQERSEKIRKGKVAQGEADSNRHLAGKGSWTEIKTNAIT